MRPKLVIAFRITSGNTGADKQNKQPILVRKAFSKAFLLEVKIMTTIFVESHMLNVLVMDRIVGSHLIYLKQETNPCRPAGDGLGERRN